LSKRLRQKRGRFLFEKDNARLLRRSFSSGAIDNLENWGSLDLLLFLLGILLRFDDGITGVDRK